MPFATFRRAPESSSVIVATAVHNGGDLRSDVSSYIALDQTTRLREEDPYTSYFAEAFPISAVVHRSRFEVDVNRPREIAIYSNAEDAWGLEMWKEPLPSEVQADSLRLYDDFYFELSEILNDRVTRVGGFVLYDLHSYNHRRAGPASEPEAVADNPIINLGTGSLPERWRPVAGAFVESLRTRTFDGNEIDVRENVKFKGRQVAAWVHERYGDVGCALAIELKKVWMDEWTGLVDEGARRELRDALLATRGPVAKAWRECAGH